MCGELTLELLVILGIAITWTPTIFQLMVPISLKMCMYWNHEYNMHVAVVSSSVNQD